MEAVLTNPPLAARRKLDERALARAELEGLSGEIRERLGKCCGS